MGKILHLIDYRFLLQHLKRQGKKFYQPDKATNANSKTM